MRNHDGCVTEIKGMPARDSNCHGGIGRNPRLLLHQNPLVMWSSLGDVCLRAVFFLPSG